jgi:hypothetical protein
MAIDWPNLLVGTALGFVAAAAYYFPAKRDADRKHRELVEMLDKLAKQGEIKLEKDTRGNIVGIASMRFTATGHLTDAGSKPALGMVTPQGDQTGQ